MRSRLVGRIAAILAVAAMITAGAVASPPPAHAVNFNLCSSWSGWRYGGDGFDYYSRNFQWVSGHVYHNYWKHSVLTGIISGWRIRCA